MRSNCRIRHRARGAAHSPARELNNTIAQSANSGYDGCALARLPMNTTELDLRHEIVRLGRMLHDRFLVSATDGNLSYRLDDDRILATPTGMSKGMMSAEDLVIVDSRGAIVE